MCIGCTIAYITCPKRMEFTISAVSGYIARLSSTGSTISMAWVIFVESLYTIVETFATSTIAADVVCP